MKKTSHWNITTATLLHGNEGTLIELNERPLWALLAEIAGEQLTSKYTRHLFCCNTPGWTAKIRWGPVDEDGWTGRSLSSQMFRFGQWASSGFGAWRQFRKIGRIPVTYNWVETHYPDAGAPFNGDGEDTEQMRSKPTDSGDLRL